ncbi:MAG TPA: hypothetical protein VFT99_20590 [Roseiflexaceae bacterium]|nr:hypothetical protein [Roseiflexaceae bacterium]
MPVQSSYTSARSAHLFDADDLAQAQPAIYRFLAVLLWLFSFTGNVLLFGGGWDAYTAAWASGAWPRMLGEALALSFAYQALCTIVQFIFCKRWLNPLYLIALFASFVPSFIGYAPLVIEPLAGLAPRAILYVGLGLVLLLTDIVPERIFVKR